MQILCFSLNFHPLMLTSLVDLAYSNYYCGVLDGDFLFLSLLLRLLIGILLKRRTLSHLFIYSIICIITHGCLFYSLAHNLLLRLLILLFKLFQLWSLTASFRLASCVLHTLSFYSPCPSPESTISPGRSQDHFVIT